MGTHQQQPATREPFQPVKDWVGSGEFPTVILIALAYFSWRMAQRFADRRIDAVADTIFAYRRKREELENEAIALLAILQADRVVVSEFTNGEHSMTGKRLINIRIAHEETRPSVEKVTNILRTTKIPTEDYQPKLDELVEQGSLLLTREDIERLDVRTQDHLLAIGVEVIYQELLRDRHGKLMGILTIHYTNSKFYEGFQGATKANAYRLCVYRIRQVLDRPSPWWKFWE